MSGRTLIIAEAGVNHNGDLGMARQLVDVAAEAGADLVKFQTFSADRFVTMRAQRAEYQSRNTEMAETQRDMLRRLELTSAMHETLIEHCASRGIGFFSTGFDRESVDQLVRLGLSRFKIPSGEITNLPYLRHIGAFGKPVILSTGMSSMEEIAAALEVLELAGTPRRQITVLHCTTEYPAPLDEVNLRAMQTIGLTFKVPVGYSDHTAGIEIAIAAVALGATVIEKHFTLNRTLPGPDHKASLEPAELKAMVNAIRNVEIGLGDGVKRIGRAESKNLAVARKSIVASCAIQVGERFTPHNLTVKRPGGGISPMRWDEVIGTISRNTFQPDDPIVL